MRRKLPPLNSLIAFEAAARLGGFSRAARELGVAQPAVTRHITNLEEWLGKRLFSRHKNSVELNADGFAMAELVTTAFDRLELGTGQLTSMRRGEIVIGASFGMMHMWLMPQITAMRGVVGGATINFVTSENYTDFDVPGINLSVRFGNGEWQGRKSGLIFSETTFVIAAPDFLDRNPSIDVGDLPRTLKPEWLLDHGDQYGNGWMTWSRWYSHYGVKSMDLSKAREISNYPTVLDMVRCAEGVALGYVGLDDYLVETGEIIRLGEPLNRPEVGYYLVASADDMDNTICSELMNFLTVRDLN